MRWRGKLKIFRVLPNTPHILDRRSARLKVDRANLLVLAGDGGDLEPDDI